MTKKELKKQRDTMRSEAVKKLDEIAKMDEREPDLSFLDEITNSHDQSHIGCSIKLETYKWMRLLIVMGLGKHEMFNDIYEHAEVPF